MLRFTLLFLFGACLIGSARAVPVVIRALNEAGLPVAGAQVSYFDAGATALPAPVQTAADGTLALDLRGPEREAMTGSRQQFVVAEPGLGAARVQAAGYGYANAVLQAGENLVTLRAPARLRGTVVGPNGAPIPNASVKLHSVGSSVYPDQSDRQINARLGFARATTGADGTWQLAGLPQGYATVEASAPGAVKTQVELWSVYDVARALQWLGEIKDDRDQNNNRLEATRLAIVATALTPPASRPFVLGAF